MTHAPPPEPLDPETVARLTDFARGCSVAARAVSLYPAAHPSVVAALDQLAKTADVLTAIEPIRLTVLPDGLLLGGRAPANPSPVVPELAHLLHQHQIVGFDVHDGGSSATWLTLLSLLARAPEENREAGGIAHLWGEHGNLTTGEQRRSIVLREVDYEQLLREPSVADPATLAEIFECLRSGRTDDLGPDARAALAKVIQDPAKLALFASELEDDVGGDEDAHTTALLQLLRAAQQLLEDADGDAPGESLANLARMLSELSAEALSDLLRRRGTPEAMVEDRDAIQAVTETMASEDVERFVSTSIVDAGGASGRLAEAFQALVPDIDQQRRLLSLVERTIGESPLGQADNFRDVWEQTQRLLTSYSDEQYVSAAYANELNLARTRATEVEQISDDPEERIGGWLDTIGDPALRALDLQLLLDLLALERDPHRWRDIGETATQYVEELTQAGQLSSALLLLEGVAQERPEDGPPPSADSLAGYASELLDRVAKGPAPGHVLAHLRTAEAGTIATVKRVCEILGAQLIPTLTGMLTGEPDARLRRAVGDVLVGFGPAGREAVRELLSAPNGEVRKVALFLLRRFGGASELAELEPLLTDREPAVQREAMLAVIELGDEPAYAMAADVLRRCSAGQRETLLEQLRTQRHDRAVPLCRYLLTGLDQPVRPDVQIAAIETLGTVGGDGAVEVLRETLYRGEWWAPFRTRTLRMAAARALRRNRSAAAAQVLREAADTGPGGVRRAARTQLPNPEIRS